MPADPFKPAPSVDTVEPAGPVDVYPTSADAAGAPAPPAAPPAGDTPTSPAVAGSLADVATPPATTEASGGGDNAGGVRALQEAFAIDIAEREERHRAEVRAMQQSFMTDVAAREDRHRAEVQALHQRFTADAATREDRQRAEVSEVQQQLGNVRAQLSEATAARDRETEGRAVGEAEVERLRDEIQVQRSDINRLNNARAELGSQLAASKQETEKWSEQARRVEIELRTARADAEKAAAAAAKQLEDKVRELEETERRRDETARSLATSEERVARLTDQASALDAASAQLRQTIAEQRAERERVTTERDAIRQQAAEFEAQLRKTEFEAEQADEDGSRQLDEAARKIEAAEEAAARAVGQVTVHEATIEELRRAVSEAQIELKKTQVDRDAARRRISSLEAEVEMLQGESMSESAEEKAEPAAEVATSEEAPAKSTPAREPVVELDESGDDRPLSLSEDVEIVAWQREALAAWSKAGHRGVVEAITGAGKTPLAFWAIGEALDADMKVLVIAPNDARVDHWYDGLRSALPINRVGKRTGAKDEHLGSADVVVATAQDAARESFFGSTANVLIVADQVHSYGTREDSRALDPVYSWRLGLTALYERDDNGAETYLDPYFGGVRFRLGYERALADGVVVPFDIAVVSVSLNNAEQAEYDALGQQLKDLEASLVGEFGVPAEPNHAFAEAVVGLADGRMGPPRTAARAYQKAVTKRDDIVSKASAKATVLKALAEHARDNEPALIFVPNQDEASYVAKAFSAAGCATKPLSGGPDRKLLGRKSDGVQDDDIVLVAGAGSGNARLGIVVGDSRDRLQLIQRLGQVIREGAEGKQGRLVAVQIDSVDSATGESPSIKAIEPHAASTQRLSAAETAPLRDFLAPAPATDASEDSAPDA